MSLYPTNTAEEAAEAVLSTLRSSTTAFVSDFSDDQREAAVLGAHLEGIARAVRQFAARWSRLDRDSPYRWEPIEECVEAIQTVQQLAEGDREVAQIVDLDEEMAELLTIETKLDVASAIVAALEDRSLSARAASKSTGISYSYVSELQGARGSLPSDTVCQRLDELLETDLETKVAHARAGIEELRGRARERRRQPAGGVVLVPGEVLTVRVQTVVARLVEDDTALEQVEDLLALPDGVRRSLGALVTELRDSFS